MPLSKGLVVVLALSVAALVGALMLYPHTVGPSTSTTTAQTSIPSSTSKASPTPTSTIQPHAPGLPTEDVEGNDLPGVPRYQPSIRIYYSNETLGNALFTSIVYYTGDSVDRVVEFYEGEMPGYNWTLIEKSVEAGEFSIPILDLEIKGYTYLDFRRPGCTDPERCLPYVKISVGEVKVGGESLTIISLDYEDYAETQPPPTSTPQATPQPSGFAAKFAGFIEGILADALNAQPQLIKVEGDKSPVVAFTLPSPITDVSEASKMIVAELVKSGIPESIIMVETEGVETRITVISWEIYGRVGSIVISIYAGSNTVEAYFLSIT